MLGPLVPARSALNCLKRLNFTRQVPRPRHAGADWVAQQTVKARFRARMQRLLQDDPERALEIGASR